MNSKSKLKYMTVLCAFLAMVLLPCKAYAACHNVSCGCRANGIMSCAGATCWYTDSDGCSGHSWYLYDEYGATCTSGGSVEYHCSICPGRRITSSPPLGHDWGSSGSNQASYTLRETDEGERTFVIEATDNVGHISRSSVTTRYDITPPGIDGTEITFVRDGIVVSGYMQDNIMDQHIDDEIVRSVHGANKSSGIKGVIVYKVSGTKEEVIYLDTTYHQFASPDTHSFFDVYYDINQTEDAVDYYLIITRDFAGNQTKKKLTSQRTLLTMFRTSIDRGAY